MQALDRLDELQGWLAHCDGFLVGWTEAVFQRARNPSQHC